MEGKVILISGNKRAGKTTLSVKLHKEYGFNFYNFDMILDAIEEGITKKEVYEKYFDFFEEIVEGCLKQAKNYGISSVIDTVEFGPSIISKSKHINEIKVYYLANLDANIENIQEDLLNYSKEYDWPSYCTKEDLERNTKYILNRNKELIELCKKYNFTLINTSRAENRKQILNELAQEIGEVGAEIKHEAKK